MNYFETVKTSRICRGLVIAASALALASCVTAIEPDGSAATADLFDFGYKNISERYIEQVDLSRVSIAGLNSLSQIDPNLSVSSEVGLVRLNAADVTAAQWPTPDRADAAGWARVVSQAVEAARVASPEARKKSANYLSNVVFRGVMTNFDRYSRYSGPRLARRNRAMREGFGGLGITIRYADGTTHVDKVHPDTPASRAGLRPNDVITRVDGVHIEGLGQADVITVLRGEIGSKAKHDTLQDRPHLTLGPRQLSADGGGRALIIPPTVTASREKQILTLKISSFNQGTAAAVSRELSRAEREMGSILQGVVLDLRNNPGGLLDQAVSVVDLFLTDGLVISTQGRHPRSDQVFDATWGELIPDVPVVVLVNGKSASAAEIVAVALRDRGRAVVIGSASYGKGTVQTIVSLPNKGELTLTWARMHAPSGFALQDHGIIPAICTSSDTAGVAKLVGALRASRRAGTDLLENRLKARLARRSDPQRSRAACPPHAKEPAADMAIARYLFEDRRLYTRTLVIGRPAVAERPRNDARARP
jgi:carboxyl-terminal processing protease